MLMIIYSLTKHDTFNYYCVCACCMYGYVPTLNACVHSPLLSIWIVLVLRASSSFGVAINWRLRIPSNWIFVIAKLSQPFLSQSLRISANVAFLAVESWIFEDNQKTKTLPMCLTSFRHGISSILTSCKINFYTQSPKSVQRWWDEHKSVVMLLHLQPLYTFMHCVLWSACQMHSWKSGNLTKPKIWNEKHQFYALAYWSNAKQQHTCRSLVVHIFTFPFIWIALFYRKIIKIWNIIRGIVCVRACILQPMANKLRNFDFHGKQIEFAHAFWWNLYTYTQA